MDNLRCLLAGLLCFFYFLQQTSCHLCLISPPQRGSIIGLNKAASPDCILLKPVCGGRDPDPAKTVILRAGQNFTITFQKNLNHWTASSPGRFTVSIGKENSGKLKELAVVKDNNEPNLHLYTTDVTIPSMSLKEPLVLQVVYVTNNPKAPPAFYQCSDVIITDRF